jgi:fructose-1,6-bisphosphatase/inositol monophosphatase family enzyme
MHHGEAAGSVYPAKHVARLAAIVHLRARQDDLEVRTKHLPIDLVTELDREAERQLVSAIRTARADDMLLGEEGTNITGSSEVCWILDPLDGTTNFVHWWGPAFFPTLKHVSSKARSYGVSWPVSGR